jgi:hypothetical protein
MTAEVAIANKLAVALAADSIVTITSGRGDKTYNAANKLFTLSKFHPVGILIYGSTTINGIPLEIIIKEFRHQLGRKEFDELKDYAENFLKFLHTKIPIEKSDQESNYRATANSYCTTLFQDIRSTCIDKKIMLAAPKDRLEFLAIVRGYVRQFAEAVKSAGKSPSMEKVTAAALAKLYPNIVERRVSEIFGLFSLPTKDKRNIIDAIYAALLSNLLCDGRVGFVIAGFGRRDYYPVIEHCETDGFFADRMKLFVFEESKVDSKNQAFVYPLAQRDASVLFMEGVDPLYQDYIDETLRELLSGLADVTASHYGVSDAKLIAKAKEALTKVAGDFSDNLTSKRIELFASRALDAVEFLDKNEMAILAESLVSLTALRQKVSLDIETVGGPIDVAVISKGDGFIWVKRKHYFSAEYNPFYMQKYLDIATKLTK